MTDLTARLQLPLLASGQAQKDLFHNEALARLDAIVQPSAVAASLDQPPADPQPGQCWVVGDAPAGDWAGQAGALAAWTDGGWRFVAPLEGMTVWLQGDEVPLTRIGGSWRHGELRASALLIGGAQVVGPPQPAIAEPGSAGAVVDAEARAAITAVIVALRTHGLIQQ